MDVREALESIPQALGKLKEADNGGMLTQDFFENCRKLDKQQNPLRILKVLYEGGYIGFVPVLGAKNLRIRFIASKTPKETAPEK